MAVNSDAYQSLRKELGDRVTLVAVSKTKPVEDIQSLYDLGQRDFGENYVQELVGKQRVLPADVRWHFIGHLQSNKVKQIAAFVYLIHGIDSFKLLEEINKQAAKNNRIIQVLLQVHIAQEETKFGFDEAELADLFNAGDKLAALQNICLCGLMGMASFTSDQATIEQEFETLQQLFLRFQSTSLSNVQFNTLSMGMSGDYKLAVQHGSNMVRVGSLLFGAREKFKM
jgi:pyridoxal phosphate enzyme (YggS family)